MTSPVLPTGLTYFLRLGPTGMPELLRPCLTEQQWLAGREEAQPLLDALRTVRRPAPRRRKGGAA
jgi:hypothetical protein